MKKYLLPILTIFLATHLYGQSSPCGLVFNDTFDEAGALPSEWTEYNTSGRITVENGYMKFNHNESMPSAYRTCDTITGNFLYSFDVQASRNAVDCEISLISSDGKSIASIGIGKNTADVYYASAIDSYTVGVTKEDKFKTNTYYSISIYVDFTTQTVDYYYDGELTVENVPFLESANDMSTIDIQIRYMWSNTGTFFFDNISVYETDNLLKLELYDAYLSVQSLLSLASIGDRYSQYPQSAADTLALVIQEAGAVLNNCNASDDLITEAIADLEKAEADFLSAQIDPIALTLYAEYNFSGEEKEMKCGYYNGTLNDYEDKAVSFKLKKGYMATFAQNINGTGVSKVYIASEEDIAINLPSELQKSISFVRVGPWRDTQKKGASGKSSNNDVTLALNAAWFYDWGNADASIGDCEYVVMNWGGSPSLSTMERLGSTMDITHHLAFNEPDGEKQANMTVDKAITDYETLLASGLRLGAPAVTDGAKGRAWLDEFMQKAMAAGYRIDFIPVHYYKTKTASGFYTWLKDFYDEYQIPIWVTEFNYGDIYTAGEKDKTEAQVLSAITDYCEMMDEADFIERYCIFTWQPSQTSAQTVMSVRSPVTLNSIGEYYANHQSPVAYQQETYQQGEPSSIAATSAEKHISIAPKIVTDGILHIKNSGSTLLHEAEIVLFDVNGRVAKHISNPSSTIDVDDLPKGFYIVQINLMNDSYAEKVIIE